MQPDPGLYAAGEIVGGLFFHNYASGTGLMSGAVFGRIAGEVLRGTRDLLIDSGAVWIYVI